MRKRLRALGAACVLAFAGTCAIATGAQRVVAVGVGDRGANSESARPALWRVYDMIVDFEKLPRTYTCDQLWYEFHGILLRLGAPLASIDILPYDCSPSPSGDMKSPKVEARFQLPFVLQPGVPGAPIEAVERTIRLAPGKPKTLHASDCQLLRQINGTMFASLPVKVHTAHFDCSAPRPLSGKFSVTLSLPVIAMAPTAAATGVPTAGSAPH